MKSNSTAHVYSIVWKFLKLVNLLRKMSKMCACQQHNQYLTHNLLLLLLLLLLPTHHPTNSDILVLKLISVLVFILFTSQNFYFI